MKHIHTSNMKHTPSRLLRSFIGAAAFLGITTAMNTPASGADWTGGGANNLWSTPQNWNPVAAPGSGTVIVFNDADKTTLSTPNSRVNANLTVHSLAYGNFGTGAADWQVTQIDAGTTLTATSAGAGTGIFVVGGNAGGSAPQTTQVAFTGGGELKILNSSRNIELFNQGNAGLSEVILDLSGLGRFETDVNAINLTGAVRSRSVVTLAEENLIKANQLNIGRLSSTLTEVASPSILRLGNENTLHITDIRVAGSTSASTQQRTSGLLEFDDKSNDSSVSIRGSAGGTTRANMYVGVNLLAHIAGATTTGTADFRGGSVDAMLNNLQIGSASNGATNNAPTMIGSFYMDAGSIDAVDVLIGQSTGAGVAGAGTGQGLLQIEGGTFKAESMSIGINAAGAQNVSGNLKISGGTVEVEDGILLGERLGTASSVAAAITIEGTGALEVGGDIRRGAGGAAVNASIALRGGELQMNGHDIEVDSLALESGVLGGLGEFNAGATLVKTTSGVLHVEGANGYTGTTDIQAGTLLIHGGLQESSVLVRDGAALGGQGVILKDATIEDGGSLLALLNDDTYVPLTLGGLTLEEAANLSLTLDFAPILGLQITLASISGGDAISGTFATVNQSAIGEGGVFQLEYGSHFYDFALIYGDNTTPIGHDLVIMAVPEPSVWMLLAMGLLAHQWNNRRRRKG